MTNQSLILIVDDNTTNARILFEVLEAAGFKTLIANSGEAALDKLAVVTPDLILLDVTLPGIDGFETCDRIQANPAIATIPIIFTTALADVEHKVKGLRLGAVDYITKPFQQAEVLARVQIHLRLRQQTQQLQELNEVLEQRVADRTEQLSRSLTDLQTAQLRLVQQEKMSTLGQLVAGIGHEINNPLNAIVGNLNHAHSYVQDLFQHIQLYQKLYPNPAPTIAESAEAIDLSFLEQDLPRLLSSMRVAADRIAHISRSLRTFSRNDGDKQIEFRLEDGIESTLLLLQHRLKGTSQRPAIQIIKSYANLAPMLCFPGQLNQVFMNLFANAIDAIDEANQLRSFNEILANPNVIRVSTELNTDVAVVRIQDNGIGMSEAVRQRIFDSAFTTKPIGKGTGLGLAIAHQIIVDRHQGRLFCESSPNSGTEFTIELPLSENPEGVQRPAS